MKTHLVATLAFLRRLWHFGLAHLPWRRVHRGIVAERRELCLTCQATDPSGERLYRIVTRRPVCGRPSDPRAPGHLLVRDDALDGCGCWLDLKWLAKGESCPLGRWPR